MRWHVLGMFVVAGFICAGAACADPITVMNGATDWNSNNYAREYYWSGWGEDQYWAALQNRSNSIKEWLWMDIGTSWESSIPAGQQIVSATLTFSQAGCYTSNTMGSAADVSVFAVPDNDKGRTTLGAIGGAGSDLAV